MNSTYLPTIIAAAAAIASTAAMAWPTQARTGQPVTRAEQVNPVLRLVPNTSAPGDAAYRWQYFSDPRAMYAVMISPLGEYFLSRGDGPKQITGPTDPVSAAQPAHS